MKVSAVATVFALATAASAQLDNIPKCALSCFLGPLGSDGCSDLADFACHCKKGTELLGQVQPCTKKACSEADQKATIEAVESTCKGAGVPIEIPDDTPAATTAKPTPEPATTSVVIVDPSADVGSSLSSAISSALSSASSAASASASHSASHPTSASVSGSASASGTPTATTSEFTGAAAQATQAVGLMGAAAIVLLAL